ncbi:hypothetical protein GN958_ATG07808 [Phytophthora infestans]|uniref:Uncharacterized protein n=1 Tax=Phytophthora infestans TaxID=4787 RepID=A0A8S9UQD0_PHYIN|nr:hypothetical protein GN958_ATG07808 [Phytophthora infestans]
MIRTPLSVASFASRLRNFTLKPKIGHLPLIATSISFVEMLPMPSRTVYQSNKKSVQVTTYTTQGKSLATAAPRVLARPRDPRQPTAVCALSWCFFRRVCKCRGLSRSGSVAPVRWTGYRTGHVA